MQITKNAAHGRVRDIEVVSFLLCYKAFYLLLIYLSRVMLPPIFGKDNYFANLYRPEFGPPAIASTFETWDARNYLFISEHGYQAGSTLNAFFPLWPFCIKAFSFITGGNHLVAAMILSNAFSIAALTLMHGWVARESGRKVANAALLLMLVFPGALFLFFPYTESLFLLLSVLIFINLSREGYLKAGAFTFFAVLTRPTGIFWVIPFAAHIIMKRRFRALAYTLFPLLGYLCYMGVMFVSTGTVFAGLIAQDKFISHPTAANLVDVVKFAKVFFKVEMIHNLLYSIIDKIWFIWFLVSLRAVYRKDLTMFFFSLAMGLLPAMGNSLMAYTRYVLMVVPMFIVSAEFLVKRERVFALVLMLLFGLQVVFLIRHINFLWVA